MTVSSAITSYHFTPGRILARKYQVVSQVARGQEGELYMLSERATGIERTAKFFYPQCNPGNEVANYYARKLHKLRHCNILMQYRTQETISVDGTPVTFLVSDFVRGQLLDGYIASKPGGRLHWFEAMHLLHALARGIEQMHGAGEFHGELRAHNLIVQRTGLGFQVKVLDLQHFAILQEHRNPADVMRTDVYDLLRLFFEALGGAKFFARQPAAIKALYCNMKRAQVEAKYPDAGTLRRALENLSWS